ncbi:hypothetical protein BANRA_02204 [Klebsiella pneumoniae]|nr:hypothetical protein KP3648_08885 [Klebsiella pneumoniae]SWF67819.1 Uncharacterised protein [Klebsiella pneumoniae]VCZ67467.1 hypothetical protein BANRA_02204 [Klebsiella pneumoniae]VDA22041.1 hypothetical protein BANRA_02724 [Klebsiella pneumoniae]
MTFPCVDSAYEKQFNVIGIVLYIFFVKFSSRIRDTIVYNITG